MNETDTSKIWGLIPEFYFDLISRIPPGLFLCFLLLIEFKIIVLENISSLSIDIGKMLLLLLLGYSLGIALSSPATMIGRLYFKKKLKKFFNRDKEAVLKFLKNHPLSDITEEDLSNPKTKLAKYLYIYREMSDFIKSNDAQAKLILPKQSAEFSMANNLSSALIFYVIVNILHSYYSQGSPDWIIISAILAVCVILYYVSEEKYDRMLGSLLSYLKIVLKKIN